MTELVDMISGGASVRADWKPSRIHHSNKCVDTALIQKHAPRFGVLLAAFHHLHRPRFQHRQCLSECGHIMELHPSEYIALPLSLSLITHPVNAKDSINLNFLEWLHSSDKV